MRRRSDEKDEFTHSRSLSLHGPLEDARCQATGSRALVLLLQPHARLNSAAARAGDPGLSEAARHEESARRGRSGVCAEEQTGAAGGRRRGEGRVRVHRGLRGKSF